MKIIICPTNEKQEEFEQKYNNLKELLAKNNTLQVFDYLIALEPYFSKFSEKNIQEIIDLLRKIGKKVIDNADNEEESDYIFEHMSDAIQFLKYFSPKNN